MLCLIRMKASRRKTPYPESSRSGRNAGSARPQAFSHRKASVFLFGCFESNTMSTAFASRAVRRDGRMMASRIRCRFRAPEAAFAHTFTRHKAIHVLDCQAVTLSEEPVEIFVAPRLHSCSESSGLQATFPMTRNERAILDIFQFSSSCRSCRAGPCAGLFIGDFERLA